MNELNLEISKCIINRAKSCIPRSNGNRKKKIVPWWTPECSIAIKQRNKAFKTLKKIICFQDLINYKRKQAEVRKIIRNAKRDYWRKYCETLGKNTALDRVWNTIKKMSGNSKESFFPIIKDNENIIIDNKNKAEVLAKVFAKVHSTENLDNKEKLGHETIKQRNIDLIHNDEEYDDFINMKFSLFELNRVLRNSSKSTPGNDQITYNMLNKLSDVSKEIILKLYNNVWEEGILPDKWKEAIIIPICKPGKDPNSAESYRPTALTSCLGKIMEKMVNNRLIYFLESKEKIETYQFGFRKGRSTIDPALCLEHEIRRAQINKESVMAIFLDVENAYDMLWKEGLLIKLKQIGIRGKIYRWIKKLLTERNIRVKIGGEISSGYQVGNGTPQGSIISPMLFIIMINDIFSSINKSFGVSLFADDGIIWKRGKNTEFINRKIQEALNKVEAWALEWGFRFSTSKSKFVVFTNRKVNTNVDLKLYGNIIERKEQIKYLGIWFDKILTWKIHIDKIV
uniref:Reverse transcriptase domain-containing protein n=1 Tax=Poecilia reticulata TaxID=8081 RepID=A0A3P9PFS3_POERE